MSSPRPRITKSFDERRAEIILTARRLFAEKGFEATKISAIAREMGVSQGVFYYYFPSKEAVVEAIIEGYIASLEIAGRDIVERADLSPLAKLEALADLQMQQNHSENAHVHAITGVDIHQRLLHAMVTRFVPLMAEAWGGGAETRAVFEIYLTAGTMLFDPGIFRWPQPDLDTRIDILIGEMERALGQPPGRLAFYRRVMGHGA